MRSLGDILYNFHWVVPGEAARGAQAWAGGLQSFLKARGIRAVINLRGPNPNYGWWRAERAAVAALGGAHIDVTLDSRHLPKREMVAALLDAFETAPKPFMVKCSGGQDRTSLAAALYLIHRDGWGAYDRAMLQFTRWPYLHLPKEHQRWLKQFLVFARGDAGGMALGEWIRTRYTPERLRDWLEANGQAGTFKGVFEKASPPHKRQW
jgi:hypothetical protein